MNDNNKEDLIIYQKINECISEGLVTPFEDDLLDFLANHTDKDNNNIKSYLSGLKSIYSISKCFRFSRYLALGMNQPFHLYEGRLNKLNNGDFPHALIETEDYVYDVSFIGKWPKKLYYQLFQPVIEKEIDLEHDEKYLEYKSNTIETQIQDEIPLLQYIDWYNYKRFALVPNPYVTITPDWLYFPQDQEKLSEINYKKIIEREWKKYKIDNDIPLELFSKELSQFIDGENYIKEKDDLYRELIKFIINNYDLYEEKKDNQNDLTLWKKAIEGKYSGSFCFLISSIPKVITQIKENEQNIKPHKL